MSNRSDYHRNVFINCPFDNNYYDLLRSLIFVVCYFGFRPRISLEESDSGLQRLKKILRLMRESRYSIHGLSRLKAKTIDEYYRLNMPFELGIDYGLRMSNKKNKDKRFLVLEEAKYEYMKAISDINGFDIKNHNGNALGLIKCLRSWFLKLWG